MFDITGKTLRPVAETRSVDEMERWWTILAEEGRARMATESLQRSMTSTEIEALARKVFEEVSLRAVDAGVALPTEFILRLIGELSGMGPLLELIARPEVEDIAINLGHIYVYTTTKGWEHAGPAPEGIGDALRVMIDRAGQRAPTPDYPITDAMLQVMVPLMDGTVRRKGVRINYVMPPASPYGDTITLRVSNYRTASDLTHGSLALLCQNRLPPVPRPQFDPQEFPRGDGILTPEAANYLLSVMVHGGTLVIAGTTGSGKTFVGQRILQEMLDYYPRGAIRLFIVAAFNKELHLPSRPMLPMVMLNVSADVLGSLFYVLAVQSGRMDIAAVLGSLYSGATVLLAWLFLREKIIGIQRLGIVIAMLAIVLITL